MTVKIAPSLLSANFTCLGDEVARATSAGADAIHLDIMDGHFVPNITFGPLVVKALRPLTELPFMVHLMIEDPDRYIGDFAAAGADYITVHQETCPHLHRTLRHIKSFGVKAGVTLNPSTSITTIEDVVTELDTVLIMTVNPGFGAQEFISAMLPKIRRAREMLDSAGMYCTEIEVDGGIDQNTCRSVVEAGATVLIAGNAIFAHPEGIEAGISKIRAALAE